MPGDLPELRERLVEAALAGSEDHAQLMRSRLEHLIDVKEPLVLISQVQRSGGTLLSQLFDGHPSLHAHPHELQIGFPTKEQWPPLDLEADADAWFDILREPHVQRAFEGGYSKHPRKKLSYDAEEFELRPFLLPPSLQHAIFTYCVAQGVASERELLDAYLTSYFNAWLDNQNLYGQDKSWVTGFAPRLVWGEGRHRFFETYPSGRLVCILRDPGSWFASARLHAPQRYGDMTEALEQWSRSTREILGAAEEYGGRVYVVSFEDLVREPEAQMRAVASWLGIEWDPILTRPTFNRFPIRANSIFRVPGHGLLGSAADRRSELSESERAVIDASLGALHRTARDLVTRGRNQLPG